MDYKEKWALCGKTTEPENNKMPTNMEGARGNLLSFQFQNGKALPTSGYLLIHESQQVHVEEASENDEGDYVCTAENPAGRVQKDIAVTMLSESGPLRHHHAFCCQFRASVDAGQ